MFWRVVQWLFSRAAPRTTMEVESPADDEPHIIVVRHRVGAEWYVWRYPVDRWREARRLPGMLANQGGAFSWCDAAKVCHAMSLAERDAKDAQDASAV